MQNEELRTLETEEKYVFHGSEDGNISVFEPRQAYTVVNGKDVEDDKPAVHASLVAEVAILMALINRKNCPGGYDSGFKYKDGKAVLHVSRQGLNQLTNDTKGFVYVFSKEDFIPRGKLQSISYFEVKPIKVIEVTKDDLPKDIEII